MSAAPVEKLLYSRKDAAYALSVSIATLDRYIAAQLLKTRRLGGRVVIPAREVKSFADRVERQDILLQNGVPVSKRQLQIVARSHEQHGTQSQEVPEEGARRLRASAR